LSFIIKTYAQKSEGYYILKKVSNFYASIESYSVDMEYNMYRGYEKIKKTESYSSILTKDKEKLKVNFLEYEMYAYTNFKLTVSEKEKVIIVNKSDNDFSPALLYKQIETFGEIGKISIKEKNKKTIHLVIQISEEASYSLPYSKIDFVVQVSDYQILNQTLFFNRKIPFKKSDGSNGTEYDKACLEIKIQPIKTKGIAPITDYNQFVSFSSDNKITLTNKFKNYELVDQRN